VTTPSLETRGTLVKALLPLLGLAQLRKLTIFVLMHERLRIVGIISPPPPPTTFKTPRHMEFGTTPAHSSDASSPAPSDCQRKQTHATSAMLTAARATARVFEGGIWFAAGRARSAVSLFLSAAFSLAESFFASTRSHTSARKWCRILPQSSHEASRLHVAELDFSRISWSRKTSLQRWQYGSPAYPYPLHHFPIFTSFRPAPSLVRRRFRVHAFSFAVAQSSLEFPLPAVCGVINTTIYACTRELPLPSRLFVSALGAGFASESEPESDGYWGPIVLTPQVGLSLKIMLPQMGYLR
jgi:hypothetical protein